MTFTKNVIVAWAALLLSGCDLSSLTSQTSVRFTSTPSTTPNRSTHSPSPTPTPTPTPSPSPSPTPSPSPSPTSSSSAGNVMQITVNGSLCSQDTTGDIGYFNKPCASVTICQQGTNNCETISDILVDTGSYGLRVFASGINADGSPYNLSGLSLPAVQQSGQAVADCVQFLDGSGLWGPVVRADVILATNGERASVPIQLINSSYAGGAPSTCDDGQVSSNAVDAGFNGILGIGQWKQDCGLDCDPAYVPNIQGSGYSASYYPYYTCSGNSCTQALISIANQIANPAASFPINNNGLIFELPSISSNGVSSVNGSVVFGIGTGNNNNNVMPSSVKKYTADAYGSFATVFNGTTYSDASTNSSITGSFIDSGSSTFLLSPPSGLNCCSVDSDGNMHSTTVSCSSSNSSGWICGSYNGTAMNEGVDYTTGGPQAGTWPSTSFSIGNFYSLFMTSDKMAFSNVGNAEICSSNNPCTFDFGLPFFFGRNVYVGFQNITGTTLVTQPYWAY